MRKIMKLISVTMLLVFLFVGCGIKNDTTDNGNEPNNGNVTDNADTSNNGDTSEDESNIVFKAEVIEIGNSLLIAPDQESNEYKSSDKISVSLNDTKLLNSEDKEITKEEIKVGDIIEVTYNGVIMESYPAQINASSIKVVDHNIVIDGYLAIIDDLYQEDEALNSEIKQIAFDTTDWIELTDIQKEMLFAKVNEMYGYEVIEGTYDELAEEGVIDKENLLFQDGILITLSNMQYNEKKNELTCDTKKWRSGKGAIGANVTAQFDGTNWNIKKDGMWIS
jgi:hypothetical protein